MQTVELTGLEMLYISQILRDRRKVAMNNRDQTDNVVKRTRYEQEGYVIDTLLTKLQTGAEHAKTDIVPRVQTAATDPRSKDTRVGRKVTVIRS